MNSRTSTTFHAYSFIYLLLFDINLQHRQKSVSRSPLLMITKNISCVSNTQTYITFHAKNLICFLTNTTAFFWMFMNTLQFLVNKSYGCFLEAAELQSLPSWKISADLLYDWYHMKCEKEALGKIPGKVVDWPKNWLEIALKKASSLSSLESWDRWDKRSNSSSETVSGSDTSGSGRTTICLTFRPDFVCRKTVSKYIVKRKAVQTYLKSKATCLDRRYFGLPKASNHPNVFILNRRQKLLQRQENSGKDKQGCKGAMWTNLEVTAVISQKDHMENCPVDEHLAYKMEKKAILKKRSAEETTPISTIYDQEASAASADSATSGQFPIFKRVKSAMYLNRAKCVVKTPKPI
ncbi:NADH-ubiquinone oxidoreductase chain 5 [Trichinella spiralis]|uniref:NADH-ubiquinone oxidoreductase chain 5 n=1 Tax=Trichinella spiralis TaxID=6334 RepID=UPI0001EFB8AF|nr:NADH-ubiquinone oxidoreductase chain 5 [Trichinella spiralis]